MVERIDLVARARRPSLSALTGVRFFAAMHVVLFHYLRWYLLGAPWLVSNVIHAGYVGVSLFFVLSGFILTYTYLDIDGGPALDRRSFWVARLARIYPLYLLSLLLALPFAIHPQGLHSLLTAAGAAGLQLLPTVIMIQAWSPTTAELINSPAWSLSVEAFFYLMFPFLAISLVRLPARRLVLAVVVLWAASLAGPTIYAILNPDRAGLGFPEPGQAGIWIQALKYSPLLRLPEFLLGVVTATIYLRIRGTRTVRGAVLSAISLLGIVAVLAASSVLPFPYLHNGLLAPLFASLILGLALGGGAIARFLGTRTLVLLGEASYGIYLLQTPLWNLAGHYWKRFTGVDPYLGHQPLFFLVYLPVLIGGSVFALYWVEKPARRWIKQLLLARTRSAVASRLRMSAPASNR